MRHTTRSLPISLVILFVFHLAAAAAPPEGADAAADEKLLKDVKVATDGPNLLAFLRKRVATGEVQQRVALLIEKLASGAFRTREKASAELVAIGLPARPALVRALEHRDAEVRRRANECIAVIDRLSSGEVEAAAVRLVKVRRPEGACVVLLDYLPGSRDATVEEEVLSALLVVGVRDGKADEVLVRALEDKTPARRAAAALVLGHSGTTALRAKVRAILRADSEARVRLRAAQGLIAARDKQALPDLLPLLTDAPLEVAREAHDLLGSVAGDRGPAEPLGEDATARKKCRASWDMWWKASGAELDLAKAEVGLPWQNSGQRARAGATLFINALMKGDAAALGRSIEVPFNLGGFMTLTTRQDFDRMFGQALTQPQRPKLTFSPPRLGDLNEYLKTMRDRPGMDFKAFLGKYPRAEIRVVYVTATYDGTKRAETAALLVRVRGGRAKVIGIGDSGQNHERK